MSIPKDKQADPITKQPEAATPKEKVADVTPKSPQNQRQPQEAVVSTIKSEKEVTPSPRTRQNSLPKVPVSVIRFVVLYFYHFLGKNKS